MNKAHKLEHIEKVAGRLGIRKQELQSHGPYKAKVDLSILARLSRKPGSKYILVSAITPTPLGEGKTVTTIALSMAFHRLGAKSACALRQSSLGPLFGAKGVASGGGASCVLPSDEVNLHFTGDSHAVGEANNLLVAFLENSVFHGNKLDIVPESMAFKRCLDTSDRSLRHIRYTLRSGDRKFEIDTGFEVTPASEVMSILALSRDLADLKKRLSGIVVARDSRGRPVTARDIKVDGAMAAVLKDAIKPNIVQTSERTPCFIHTGPFANVSVGSSSIIADRIALGLCDFVVTESGFGADCGAEKFFDIKCRASGLKPDACVLVCSVRGLKAQSSRFDVRPGAAIDEALYREDLAALEEGAVNLKKQVANVRQFGIPVFVCVNIFKTDTKKEIELVKKAALASGCLDAQVSTAWKDGSRGILGLARSVARHTKNKKSGFRFLYSDDASIKEKIEAVAAKVYGAGAVAYSAQAAQEIEFCASRGFGRLPVCIAKTQFSLSHDESLKGAPKDFILPVKDVRLASGAGFILAHASTMQTMPGLPRRPRGEKVDVDTSGRVIGME